ncbi:MAG: hypothetical protein UT63_C0068G0010 [Candidatus Gottesmanbacteria bacterium GW2011_GWC2_39_8]|uniref:DUF6680 domain-containing protein n=1 Tax=Candidatus Gottesmanbacteria bacterium GW2011_GWC2_39_8 TaxID=1618450 RepID=A0A0G0S9Q8_9BACT|nr:MAG: hypothetical protein UT63_C0068G0010 [Candidatus Gottesmanbacteria bacterium GW2011_GWC2_39_8]
MTSELIITLIVSGISTIVSPLFAIWISEKYIRRRNLEDAQRKQVLNDLIANRYKVDTDEFLRAFNSVIMYWGKEDIIKKLVFEYRTSSPEKKTPILTEIIYNLCILEKITHLSREDILNIFLKS